MNDWISRAEEVAMEVLAQHAETVDQQGQWPDRSLAALAESGLMGLTIPSELDGAGEGPSTFLEVMQCLSRQCASTGMIYLMHTCATQVILSATMFSCLGINPDEEFYTPEGRPVKIANNGRVLRELM